MLNKTLSPEKTRTLWTENRRAHKAKVSVTSRSKSKTDGFLLQMVGYVLSPSHTSPISVP